MFTHKLDFKIKCKNWKNGCDFTSSELAPNAQIHYKLEQHEKSCDKCPDCKVECKEGCKKLFFNHQMAKHAKTCKKEQEELRKKKEKEDKEAADRLAAQRADGPAR